MKKDIHPKYQATKVHCNGCGIEFETRSTVPEITVEICSNCHPFYTGKQKLVDVAGRVDRFKAQQAAAASQAESKKPKARSKKTPADIQVDPNESLKELKKELEAHTVETQQ